MADIPDMIVRVEGLQEILQLVKNLRAERVKMDVLINRLENIASLQGKRV